MNKKLFTLLPLLALGLVACGDKPVDKGRGSLENPLNVDEVLAHADVQELEDKGETEEYFYVTGKTVKASYNDSYGSFSITLGSEDEDSGAQFQFYSLQPDESLVLEGTDEQGDWTYKSDNALKTATFIGYGKVYRYGTTYEFHYQHDGKLVGISGATKVYKSTDTHGTTEEDPLTFAEALAGAKALEAGSKSDSVYFIRAKVAKVSEITYAADGYGNMGFDVNASGAAADEALTVFRGKVSGGQKSADCQAWLEGKLVAGAEVLIQGKLQHYVKNDNHSYQISDSTVWFWENNAKVGYVPAN